MVKITVAKCHKNTVKAWIDMYMPNTRVTWKNGKGDVIKAITSSQYAQVLGELSKYLQTFNLTLQIWVRNK